MTKTVLVVAAHPDDEAIGCSGAMARHINEGDSVYVVFMTNGVGARGGDRKAIDKRNTALDKACGILGITEVQAFDFPDNGLDSVPLLEVVQVLENAINEIQPDVIYTHHGGDLNVDHQITHKAVMTACRPQPGVTVKEIYAFEVLSSTEWQTPGIYPFTPNVFVDITDYIETKRKVLEAYEEEMREPPHSRSIDNAIRMVELRGNSVGFQFAEAFVGIRILK